MARFSFFHQSSTHFKQTPPQSELHEFNSRFQMQRRGRIFSDTCIFHISHCNNDIAGRTTVRVCQTYERGTFGHSCNIIQCNIISVCALLLHACTRAYTHAHAGRSPTCIQSTTCMLVMQTCMQHKARTAYSWTSKRALKRMHILHPQILWNPWTLQLRRTRASIFTSMKTMTHAYTRAHTHADSQ